MNTATAYLESIEKHFRSYKSLAEKAMDQLTEAEMLWQPTPNSNSIAIILNHLHGNMKSRFTNFLTEDGEKPWRQREAEFSSPAGWHPAGEWKRKAMDDWEDGWNCLFEAIKNLTPDTLLQEITIRNEPHLAMDALNRQLAHYSSHVGQIVYLAKMCREENWQNLSIPKGGTEAFNADMAKKFGKTPD
jgi:hypothetical protein